MNGSRPDGEHTENEALPSVLGTPAAEYTINETVVTGLLEAQHIDLAHLPLQVVDAGWDNAMFRLGDKLAVRLPRRAKAAQLIKYEQLWLPRLARYLPLPVPSPCRVGEPGGGYPCHWSVAPWLKGLAADQSEPGASQAIQFANFLRSLHIRAPNDAPMNAFRGVPLRQRAQSVEARMARLAIRTDLISPELKSIWSRALKTPMDDSPVLLHGDLHPRNVLVEAGQITGIIDWGDITSGDCATDLASIWMLFADPCARLEALATYGILSQTTVDRARGWAVLFGVMLLDTGLIDNPRNAAMGERILRRVAGGTAC